MKVGACTLLGAVAPSQPSWEEGLNKGAEQCHHCYCYCYCCQISNLIFIGAIIITVLGSDASIQGSWWDRVNKTELWFIRRSSTAMCITVETLGVSDNRDTDITMIIIEEETICVNVT